MVKISDIPEVIFPIIQSYMTNEDYHYLIHADKRFFGSIKRKTVYYSLNHEYSMKYIRDQSFHNMIDGKINNPTKQIGLLFNEEPILSKFLQCPVHQFKYFHYAAWETQLPIPEINELPPLLATLSSLITCSFFHSDVLPLDFLPSLKELTFSSEANLKQITTVGNLQKLSLYCCSSLVEIAIDRPLLELNVEACHNLTSINRSGKQLVCQTMRIENCQGLHFHSFEQYSNIRSLTIVEYRKELPRLNHLHGIHSLSLIECPKLSNISELGNHFQLEISFLRKQSIDQVTYPLIGYEILRGIPHVILKKVNICDVTVLREAKSLYLEYCESVRDVSGLVNVRDVTLERCSNIKNLHLLTKIPRLFLISMNDDALTEYEQRETNDYKHQTLSINACLLRSFIKPMLSLTKLFLEQIHLPLQFNDDFPSSFPLLQYIGITRCKIQSMKGLRKIHTVEIRFCHELGDISDLGENHTVILSQCGSVIDVSCLVNVPVVSIIWCDLVTHRSISLLQEKVPRFTYIQY